MEERRNAGIGTVNGLALLAGGTAVAAVADGAHSVFATILLGLLTIGLGHSLLVEIRRQARRQSAGGWARHDTVNAVLLGVWAEIALLTTIIETGTPAVRTISLALSLGYAGCSGYFVTERRRAIAAHPFGAAEPDAARTAPPEPQLTTEPAAARTASEPQLPTEAAATWTASEPQLPTEAAAARTAPDPELPTEAAATWTASDQPELVAEGRGAELSR